MKTSAMMRCPKCEETSELDNLHLLDRSFKREWVGLTEAERIDIIDEEITAQNIEHFALAQAIEARLKELNT